MSDVARPMTTNSLGSSEALRRFRSAGKSLRLARSPEAPKRTSAQGSAGCPLRPPGRLRGMGLDDPPSSATLPWRSRDETATLSPFPDRFAAARAWALHRGASPHLFLSFTIPQLRRPLMSLAL